MESQSFNKINTFSYYNHRVYELGSDYNSFDKLTALEKAIEFGDKIPIGVLYQEKKQTFHQKNAVLQNGIPLVDRTEDPDVVQKIINEFI